jgi:hypothetical protein
MTIPFIMDDGGRVAAGFKGSTGDCVTRAIAIASQRPYREIYDRIQREKNGERKPKRGRGSNARTGVLTKRTWFKRYMTELGFEWVSCMGIGTGCTVHLTANELPTGRIVVALSRHYAAVINGVLHDSYNSGEERHETGMKDGEPYSKSWARCVYGYWIKR